MPVQLATVQLKMERYFHKEYQSVEVEQQQHTDRVAAKAQVLLAAKRKHITVQEMNSIYNQASSSFSIALPYLGIPITAS